MPKFQNSGAVADLREILTFLYRDFIAREYSNVMEEENLEEKYYKDFKRWNTRKEILNDRPDMSLFKERDIWWAALGCNIGSEEDGKNDNFERPIIIFRKFGEDICWVIPLTTHPAQKESRFEYILRFGKIEQTANIAQMRLVSVKRLLRFIGIIPYEDFQKIRKLLSDLV